MVFLLLVYGILLIRIGTVCGESCFYAKDICPNENISFWLRTRDTGYDGFEMREDNLDDAPLVDDAPLIISIHGWTGHKNYAPNPQLISAYLERGDYNIISVDWGKLALDDCYLTSAYNAPVAGRCTAVFLRQLYSKRGSHWKQLTHVVGFSMGAHVAGVLGYYLPDLPRITGLDPAMPLFTSHMSRPENRLDSSDADFVDVIHSNSGWMGRLSPLGDIDFYLNNGAKQPGCYANTSCDHHRSVAMFAESIISPDGFYGLSCVPGILSFLSGVSSEVCPYSGRKNLLVLAGEYVNRTARGTYKIETNTYSPFAKGLPFQITPSVTII